MRHKHPADNRGLHLNPPSVFLPLTDWILIYILSLVSLEYEYKRFQCVLYVFQVFSNLRVVFGGP